MCSTASPAHCLGKQIHLQVTQMEVDYSVREKEHMNKPPSLDNSNVRLV